MKNRLISRKFWTVLIGLLVVIAGAWLPNIKLDQESMVGFIVIATSYIVGVAVDPGIGGRRCVLQSRKFWVANVIDP